MGVCTYETSPHSDHIKISKCDSAHVALSAFSTVLTIISIVQTSSRDRWSHSSASKIAHPFHSAKREKQKSRYAPQSCSCFYRAQSFTGLLLRQKNAAFGCAAPQNGGATTTLSCGSASSHCQRSIILSSTISTYESGWLAKRHHPITITASSTQLQQLYPKHWTQLCVVVSALCHYAVPLELSVALLAARYARTCISALRCQCCFAASWLQAVALVVWGMRALLRICGSLMR